MEELRVAHEKVQKDERGSDYHDYGEANEYAGRAVDSVQSTVVYEEKVYQEQRQAKAQDDHADPVLPGKHF